MRKLFLFLKKLQLGPIDAACQGLQYALQNSARAILFLFVFFPHIFLVFIVDPTAKKLKLYVKVVNSIHYISAEVRNWKRNSHKFLKKLV
jgi:hypothetical protein